MRRAVAIVVGLLVAGVAAVAAPQAAAAAPTVGVEITSVSVSGSSPSDTVELRGRVTNPAGALVYGVRVAMWRSRDPIDDLEGVRRAVTSPPWGVILPGGYAKVTEQSDAFAPGASADFVLSATLDELGFDSQGRAYAVGVRVLGTTDGGISFGNIGQTSTVVAVPGTDPVPVTRLVVLSAPPTRITPGVFRSEELATQLRGRLDTLLTAAEREGMSWLIDPGLYDEVADMAGGYQVSQDGELVEGTGREVASAWLERFGKLDQDAGARTLFSLPDLTGAALADDPDVLARALTATTRLTRLNRLPMVLVPTGTEYTPELESYLATSGSAGLLAGNLLTAGAFQTSPSGRPVLAAVASLDQAPASVAGVQLVLAETVVAGESGQLRILDEPADLIADAATTTPWMTNRRLDELLTSQPSGTADFSPASPKTLSAGQFEQVSGLEQQFASYAQLVPDSSLPRQAAGLLTRAVSSWWVDDRPGYDAMLGSIDSLVGADALADAVSLDASPRFVMSSRTNQFPLTLVNHLDEPIRVKVVIDTDNPQRLTIPDTPAVTIPARASLSVTVEPEASGNGIAIARAWVATENGRRVTDPIRITIEMTDLGVIGWVIVIGSGAVVLGATALRVWQVRRRPAAPAGAEPMPGSEPQDEPAPGGPDEADPGPAHG